MSFLKRLFPQKREQKTVEPMRGPGQLQTNEEQERVRTKMEGEMAAERTRRDEAAKGQ